MWNAPDAPTGPTFEALLMAQTPDYEARSRGVARLYEMSIDGGVWKLWRESEDFSPLDFAQRYEGRFSDDGNRITGRWEIRHQGEDWETDFELNYVRVEAS